MFMIFGFILWSIGGINNPVLFPDIWALTMFNMQLDIVLALGLVIIWSVTFLWNETKKIKKGERNNRK